VSVHRRGDPRPGVRAAGRIRRPDAITA
jgi:hypothetical protein